MKAIDHNERVVLGKSPRGVVDEHLQRYLFAQQFVVDKDVLDVACGSGYGSALMVSAGAKRVIEVDLSYDTLTYARQEYLAGGRARFVQMDAARLGFRDSLFDVVVSFETLEHLRTPRRFLREIWRVLKPGGALVISTPNPVLSAFPSGIYRALAKKPSNPFHYREYSLRRLQQMLTANFRVTYVGGQRFISTTQWLGLTALAIFGGKRTGIRARATKRYEQLRGARSTSVTSLKQGELASFFVIVGVAR